MTDSYGSVYDNYTSYLQSLLGDSPTPGGSSSLPLYSGNGLPAGSHDPAVWQQLLQMYGDPYAGGDMSGWSNQDLQGDAAWWLNSQDGGAAGAARMAALPTSPWYEQSRGFNGFLSHVLTPFDKVDEAINPVRQIPAVDNAADNVRENPFPAAVYSLIGSGIGTALGSAFGGAGGAAGSTGGGAGSAAGASSGTGAIGGALPEVVVNGSAGGLGAAGGIGAGAGGAAGASGFGSDNSVTVNGSRLGASDVDTGALIAGGSATAGAGLQNYANNTQLNTNMASNTGTDPQAGFDWSKLIGPGIDLLGSYLGGKTSNDAALQAAGLAINASRPFNVNLPGYGSSTFDMANRTATLNPSDTLGLFQNYGSQLATQGFNGLNGGLPNIGGFGGISPQLKGLFDNYSGSQFQAPGANIYGDQQAYNGLMTQSGDAAKSLFGQLGSFNLGDREAQNLAALRAGSSFGEGQARQNNIESQFGKGVLASTAGGYQTQGLEQALQTADIQRQALAHQMAMGDQTSLLGNANGALQGYQNLQTTGFGQGYQNNLFGNTAINQMFGNALNLFGAGQAANQQNFGQNAQLYNGGQANNLSIGSYLTGLLGTGGNLGSLASGAAGQGAGILAQNGANNGNLIAGFLNNLGSSVDWSKLFNKG